MEAVSLQSGSIPDTHLVAPESSAPLAEARGSSLGVLVSRTGHVWNKLLATAGVIGGFCAFAPAALANYNPSGENMHVGAVGDHKTAAVLVNFSNDGRRPFTAEQVDEALFDATTSVSQYFREVSFGKLSLSGIYSPNGDVYDWVTLPGSYRTCDDEQKFAKLGRAANKAEERTTGRSLEGYDNYVYMMPRDPHCINDNDGSILNGVTIGNASFMNSRDLNPADSEGIDIHEIGHQFGLSHANLLRCRDGKGRLIMPTLAIDRCTDLVYRDPFDPMGMARLARGLPIDFDAINKARAGWLDPRNILVVRHSETVEIAPEEMPSSLPQLIQIPYGHKGEGQPSAYLDYRQPLGADTQLPLTSPLFRGVTIRVAGPNDHNQPITLGDFSYLIDTHPKTHDRKDAPLPVGQTYFDKPTGIKIQELGAGPMAARVRITFAKPHNS